MTGLLHFAAKIKFVPVLKSQPAAMQEKGKGRKGREKKRSFDMEQVLQKKTTQILAIGYWYAQK